MKKLLWLPIDIPKFPINDLLITTSSKWQFWNFFKMTQEMDTPYSVSDFRNEIKTDYPELIEWFKNFPYQNIRNIKFNIQQEAVRAHKDFVNPTVEFNLFKNNYSNEPCGYRILLKGKRHDTLYVENKGKKIYTYLPDSTDVYVLRHTDGKHGVEIDKNRTTIFTHFEIDQNKHKLLIEKSLEKYSNFAIFED